MVWSDTDNHSLVGLVRCDPWQWYPRKGQGAVGFGKARSGAAMCGQARRDLAGTAAVGTKGGFNSRLLHHPIRVGCVAWSAQAMPGVVRTGWDWLGEAGQGVTALW